MQLSKHAIVTVIGQATTGAVASVTGEVDMQGYEGVIFIGVAGSTATTAHTMTLKHAASTTATFASLTGATKATTSGNDLAYVDCYRPTKRFVQGVFSSTANSEKVVVAIRYGAHKVPVSSTAATAVASPAS